MDKIHEKYSPSSRLLQRQREIIPFMSCIPHLKMHSPKGATHDSSSASSDLGFRTQVVCMDKIREKCSLSSRLLQRGWEMTPFMSRIPHLKMHSSKRATHHPASASSDLGFRVLSVVCVDKIHEKWSPISRLLQRREEITLPSCLVFSTPKCTAPRVQPPLPHPGSASSELGFRV